MIGSLVHFKKLFKSIPEVFSTSLVIRPGQVGSPATQIQCHHNWHLIVRDIIEENNKDLLDLKIIDHVLCKSKLSDKYAALDCCSTDYENNLVAAFHDVINCI